MVADLPVFDAEGGLPRDPVHEAINASRGYVAGWAQAVDVILKRPDEDAVYVEAFEDIVVVAASGEIGSIQVKDRVGTFSVTQEASCEMLERWASLVERHPTSWFRFCSTQKPGNLHDGSTSFARWVAEEKTEAVLNELRMSLGKFVAGKQKGHFQRLERLVLDPGAFQRFWACIEWRLGGAKFDELLTSLLEEIEDKFPTDFEPSARRLRLFSWIGALAVSASSDNVEDRCWTKKRLFAVDPKTDARFADLGRQIDRLIGDQAQASAECLAEIRASVRRLAEETTKRQPVTERVLKRRVAVLKRTLAGHTNYVWDVVVTSDGRRVLSASNDLTVRMWDIASGNALAVFKGHNAFVCSLALSGDASHLATGAADGEIRLWNLVNASTVATFDHGADDAKVAWGVLPGQLISAGADGNLLIWSTRPNVTLASRFKVHSGPILKVVVLDEDTLVSASTDGTARLCRLSSGSCIRIFTGHTGEVNSVATVAKKRQLISASEDRTLKIWDLDSGNCVATLHGHNDTIWRVSVSPDGHFMASGAADNTVRLWDLDTNDCVQELQHSDCVAAVTFSPDGSTLAVGCDDACVYVYTIVAGNHECAGR